jgi:hypothetical protein
MMEDRLADLERRLAHAERQGRVMLCLGVCALVAALVLTAARSGGAQGATGSSPSHQAVAVAQEFRLVDPAGKPLARLAAQEGASQIKAELVPGRPASLRIYGRDNKPVWAVPPSRR